MLTQDEIRALAVVSSLIALGTILGWIDARHPRLLVLTLGDSLALGAVAGDGGPADSTGPPASDRRPGPTPADSAASPSDPAASGGYALDGRLDLNRASAEELETLPGVGPKTAARIVEDRVRRGRFRTARDLGRVKGIGPKTLARLLPLVSVASAARPKPSRPDPPPHAPTDTAAAPGAAAR